MMKNIEVISGVNAGFEHDRLSGGGRRQTSGDRKDGRRPRIHWKIWDDLIGNVTDADLARQIGCDRSTVTVRRNKIGIPPCPMVRSKAEPVIS